jgi:hypothetical protein
MWGCSENLSASPNQSLQPTTDCSADVEARLLRPRKDHRGVDLISDTLPFGRLWYGEPNAMTYAKFRSRSHDAVIRIYDQAGNVIETQRG